MVSMCLIMHVSHLAVNLSGERSRIRVQPWSLSSWSLQSPSTNGASQLRAVCGFRRRAVVVGTVSAC